MKKDTHPKYQEIKFTCACGASFTAGSTMDKEFKTELCSECHPYFTGKQKLVDSSGRVDKFVARMNKAKAKAEETKAKGKKSRGKTIKLDQKDESEEE